MLSPDDQAKLLEGRIATLISEHEASTERIGQLLHDDVGQILSGVGLQLEGLRLDCKDHPELAERLTELQGALEEAMSKVRSLSSELHPSTVDRAGLRFALERLSGRPIGAASVRLQFDPAVRLPREIAKGFYRVAEYALEHAVLRASAMVVEIQVKQARPGAVIEIRHDGSGEAPASGRLERIELLMLHHHAQRAGIPVSVETVPGRGTIVRATYTGS